MISQSEIEQAAALIEPHIRKTPVLDLAADELGLPFPLTLKLELLQHAGSFKPRGAFHRLLTNRVPAAGVVAASGGNHGLAVAYASRRLGHSAAIFVPRISPAIKVEGLRRLGAQVNIVGEAYPEAAEACKQRAAETGALMVHPYDQREVLAGQGTLAREWQAQSPALDTVLIAVGGGGLIGGMAAWYGGAVRVIGVEPETAPSLERAMAAGEPVDVAVSGVAADSLGARRVGTLMFETARAFIDRVVLVTDDQIRDAQRQLWQRLRLIAEPGGAAALAAVLSGRYQPEPGERVGVLVCGSNTDPAAVAAL